MLSFIEKDENSINFNDKKPKLLVDDNGINLKLPFLEGSKVAKILTPTISANEYPNKETEDKTIAMIDQDTIKTPGFSSEGNKITDLDISSTPIEKIDIIEKHQDRQDHLEVRESFQDNGHCLKHQLSVRSISHQESKERCVPSQAMDESLKQQRGKQLSVTSYKDKDLAVPYQPSIELSVTPLTGKKNL